ncbi:MAG: hypothetical protein ACR5KV_03095 [Wolbachia sp.]
MQKKINKELFVKLIKDALDNLKPEDIKPEIIEKALKSVGQ